MIASYGCFPMQSANLFDNLIDTYLDAPCCRNFWYLLCILYPPLNFNTSVDQNPFLFWAYYFISLQICAVLAAVTEVCNSLKVPCVKHPLKCTQTVISYHWESNWSKNWMLKVVNYYNVLFKI